MFSDGYGYGYGWGYFAGTGSIEAYLLYIEFRRLTDSEFARAMDERQVDIYDTDGTWPYYTGGKHGGSGQNPDRVDPRTR